MCYFKVQKTLFKSLLGYFFLMEKSIKPNFGKFTRLSAIQIVLYIAKAILIYQFGFKENN